MINKIKGPIVIGGIGGSGTRVVAQILKEFNIFIGDDLNDPLDNLSYTLLFKRRSWFYKNHKNKVEIFKGLKIFEKSMRYKRPNYTISEKVFLLKSTMSMYINGHNIQKDGKGKWAIDRYKKIIEGYDFDENKYTGWGWKEPNSHLIISHLLDYYPNIKYIHTIRNGLDMAFSSNQQQLFNWGPIYGIKLPESKDKIPEASFRYWLAANKKVIEVANYNSNKLYLLNFDLLCLNPETELKKLINFLTLDVKTVLFEKIKKIPKRPSSSGRYINKQLCWVTENDKIFLESLDLNI